MTMKYYAILTNQGAARLANATMLGSKLNLTQMAVGDANGVLPTPNPAQTKLINQKRIAPLNLLSVDPNNQSQIIAEQIIPEDEGGFWIREIGLYDDKGVLIAVANCPETYKPQLQEGSGRTQTIRMILVVTNTKAITLKIDPSVVLATRKYVDDKISKHEQSRRHPDASLTAKGFVQLSSTTNSTSETLAATPKAVKAAYDLANGKYTAQDATTARKGLVQLSSATNSTSETLAATPKAVKAAYDLANGKYTAQDATTARKGLVQLSSATNSTSLKRWPQHRKRLRLHMTWLTGNIPLRMRLRHEKALFNSVAPPTAPLKRWPQHRKRLRLHMTWLTGNIPLRMRLRHEKALFNSVAPPTARLKYWPPHRKRSRLHTIWQTENNRQMPRSLLWQDLPLQQIGCLILPEQTAQRWQPLQLLVALLSLRAV